MNLLAGNGLVLLLGGYIAVLLKSLPGMIWDWVFYFITESLEFDLGDNSTKHDAARKFLNNQKFIFKPKNYVSSRNEQKELVAKKGFGRFWFKFDNRFVLVNDSRREITSGLTSGMYKSYTERMTFFVFFPKRDTVQRIIDNISQIISNENKIHITVSHYNTIGQGWDAKIKPKKNLNTIFLPDNILEEIDKEIEEFINSKDWYESLGIPFHLGIMLESQPGNGKSSLIKGFSSKYNRTAYQLSLNIKDIDDAKLAKMFSDIGPGSIIAIEDIDCLFDGRENVGGVTMSGLLNVLDGIDTPHDFILFMTTNHIERLDPALLRPGRTDRIFKITNAESGQLERYFTNFFKLEEGNKLAQEFGLKAGGRTTSMAVIQNHLRHHKHNPLEAVESWGK